jgi:hypothetical protein
VKTLKSALSANLAKHVEITKLTLFPPQNGDRLAAVWLQGQIESRKCLCINCLCVVQSRGECLDSSVLHRFHHAMCQFSGQSFYLHWKLGLLEWILALDSQVFTGRATMRRAVLGLLVGVGVAVLAVCVIDRRGEVMAQHAAPYPQPTPQPMGGGELIAVPSPVSDKGQLLTVLDPRQQTMGVYWIEAGTGKITLRSVRNIRFDLMMTDFNGDNPLPKEIRLQLEQR